MEIKDLNLKAGKWLVSDCAKMPSVNNCKLVIMAPENQKSDLLEAEVAHAVKTHGETDNPKLRRELEQGLENLTIK